MNAYNSGVVKVVNNLHTKERAAMKVVLQNLTKKFPSRNKKSREEVIAVDHFNFEIPDWDLPVVVRVPH